jgi:alkylation response protein AidB-like acyl-CoA dehydrogenase
VSSLPGRLPRYQAPRPSRATDTCERRRAQYGGTPPEGGWDEFMNVIWIDELSRAEASGVVVVTFFIAYMSLPHTLLYGSPALKQLRAAAAALRLASDAAPRAGMWRL